VAKIRYIGNDEYHFPLEGMVKYILRAGDQHEFVNAYYENGSVLIYGADLRNVPLPLDGKEEVHPGTFNRTLTWVNP
jgi:hypothetical protein